MNSMFCRCPIVSGSCSLAGLKAEACMSAAPKDEWGLQPSVSILRLLLQAVLMPARFPAVAAPFTDSTRNALQNIFAFCYVWALGGALEAASRLVPGCCLLLAML